MALQKNNFSGSKNMFFPDCSHETQTSLALQKSNSGSKNSFFRMPLVESANSTLLPPLSLSQLVQMHALHN
jgi:hypothetical protein